MRHFIIVVVYIICYLLNAILIPIPPKDRRKKNTTSDLAEVAKEPVGLTTCFFNLTLEKDKLKSHS